MFSLMMIDQIRRNNHQYNNDDHSNQKIRVPPPQTYTAWSRRRHLLHHLPAFLNAPLPFLQSLLPLILRGRTLTRSRTQMLHPATHIAVVALGLLLLGIRRGYLLGLRGSRPGNSRTPNAGLAAFHTLLALICWSTIFRSDHHIITSRSRSCFLGFNRLRRASLPLRLWSVRSLFVHLRHACLLFCGNIVSYWRANRAGHSLDSTLHHCSVFSRNARAIRAASSLSSGESTPSITRPRR